MFFLSDVNAIEFREKRNTKVKSYVRKGRIVKQHDRKIDIKSALLGGGIGVLGIGALTGAYLLGKGRVPKPVIQQVSNADEIANKVISKLPKQQIQQPNVTINTDDIVSRVVSKLPKQEVVDVDDIVSRVSKATPRPIVKVKVVKPKPVQQTLTKQDVEDVVSNALGKQPKQTVTNIDYDEITKRVTASLPKQQVQTTSSISSASNVINVPITKIKLPQKINSLSQRTIDVVTKQVEEMSDDQLEKEISKYAKQFEKSTKTQLDISNARTLEGYIDQYKEGSKKFDKGYLKKQIDELLDYFQLPKQDIEQVKYNFDIDKEYVSKLNKLRTRNKNLLDIHQNELTKRRNRNTVIAAPSDEDTSRIYDLLDDFSAANELVEFCNNMNQLNNSYLFFLSDFNYV